LNVYPNPVTEILNVRGTDFSSNDILRITDLNGAIVYQGALGNGQFDVKDFAAGMYLIEAGRGAAAKRTTFIKE
jgi:Secretion system C-terminal sorting domain